MNSDRAPLDRFTVSGDYGTGADLECDDCPLFLVSVTYLALSEIVALAEEHNKEKHGQAL